jgi:hypothetical protein
MTRDEALLAVAGAGGEVEVGHGAGRLTQRYARALVMLGEAVMSTRWEVRFLAIAGHDVPVPRRITRLRLTPSGAFTARSMRKSQ